MSTTIDERVVEMRFDHSNFKKNAGETVSLLEKLKDALNFSHSNKGLNDLQKSIRSVDASPIARGVGTIRDSFFSLKTVAETTIRNITNRFVDAGIRIAKSITTDQINAGFHEYELKMNSIQTIMASTGEDLGTVNGYLEELNKYADKTIYSFSDMTSNIGKFTNAGVKLDQAVNAIKGISNEAAISGANANEASRAMYNFAQALSAGYVKLIDWKSIENANMATVDFKKQLLMTAEAMGTVVKTEDGYVTTTTDLNGKVSEAFSSTRLFNESLSHQWMTTDVLVQALNNYSTDIREMTEAEVAEYEAKLKSIGYTDEQVESIEKLGIKAADAAKDVKTFSQLVDTLKESSGSGWSQTFELIFGDLNEAKQLWTAVNEEIGGMIQASADARNKLLREALGLPEEYLDRSSTSWNNLVKQIETAGESGEEFANACRDVGSELGLIDHDAISTFDDLRESLTGGWLTSNTVVEVLNHMIGPLAYVSDSATDASHSFEEFQDVLQKINNKELGEGDELLTNLAKSGWNLVGVQNAANKALRGAEVTMEDFKSATAALTEEQAKSLGYDVEVINNLKRLREAYSNTGLTIIDDGDKISKWWTGSQLLFSGIAQGYNAIKGIFSAIGAGWKVAFPPMLSNQLYSILQGFMNVMSAFNRWVHGYVDEGGNEIPGITDNIRDAFSGLFSVFGIFVDINKEVGKYLLEKFGVSVDTLAKKILNFAGRVGQLITSFREWLKENNIIRRGIEKIVSWFKQGVSAVTGWVESLKGAPIIGSIITSIQNLFDRFFSFLDRHLPNTTFEFSQLWSKISEAIKIKDFGSIIETVKNFAKALGEDFHDAWEKVKDFFPALRDSLTGISDASEKFSFSKIPEWAKNLYNIATTVLSPVLSIFSAFADTIVAAVGGAETGFEKLMNITSKFAKAISDNLGAIISAFLLYKVSDTIYQFSKSLFKVAEAITSPVTAITSAFKNFTNAAKGLKNAFNAFAIVEAAIAMGIMGITLAKLGKLKPEEFKQGVKAVLAIGSLIVAMLWVVSLINGKGNTSIVSKEKNVGNVEVGNVKIKSGAMMQILELAAALFIVVKSLKEVASVVQSLDSKQLKTSLGIIAGALISLMLVGTVINRVGVKTEGADRQWASILAVTIAIKVMVGLISDLMLVMKDATIKQFVMALVGLSAAVSGMKKLLKQLQNVKIKGNVAGSLLAAAGAVWIFSRIINSLIDIPITDLLKSLPGFAIIAAGVAALMFGLSKMSKKSQKAGVGILAASAGIFLLVQVVKQLAKMKIGDIFKGVLAAGALMIFMGAMMKLAGSADSFNNLKAAASFLGVAAALLIIVGAVAIMTLLDPEKLMIAGIAMTYLMMAFGILLACASLVKDIKPAVFVSMAVLIAVLTGSVILLGSMDPNDVLTGVLALITLMIAAGLMALLSSFLARKGDFKPILSLAVVVAALAAGIWAIGQLDKGAIVTATAALSLAMIMFGIMSLMVKSATKGMADSRGALTAIVGMVAIITALGVVIYILASMPNPDYALKITVALSAVFLSLGVLMKGVASFGKLGVKGALVGIAGMLGVIAVIGLIMAALVQLNENNNGVTKWLEKCYPILRSIGKAIGEVVGGLLEGILDIDIGSMSEKLTTFGESVKSFSESIEGMDETKVNAVNALVKMVMALAGADLLNAITKWMKGDTTSLEAFGDSIQPFAADIKSFSDDVEGIKPENVEAAAKAGSYLADMMKKLPTSGGWKETILGTSMSMETFKTGMSTYAQALIAFQKEFADANLESIPVGFFSDAATAGGYLNDLQKKLPTTGGWKGKILGDHTTLETFGGDIEAFATGLVNFITTIAGVTNWSPFNTGIWAAQRLVTLSNSLPEGSTWLEKIFGGGQMTLKQFGENAKEFGGLLVNYSEAVANIDTTGLDTANTVSTDLLSLVKDHKTEFDASGILGTFGTNLATLGSSLKDYSDYAKDLDSEKITASVTSLSELIGILTEMTSAETTATTNVADSLEQFDSTTVDSLNAFIKMVIALAAQDLINAITTLKGGTLTDLNEFGTKIEQFAPHLKAFYEYVRWIKPAVVTAAITATRDLIDLANDLGRTGGSLSTVFGDKTQIDAFGQQLEDFATSLNTFCSKLSGEGTSFDVSYFEKAADAAGYINSITEALPAVDGWKQKIIGNPQTIGSFGDDLYNLGYGLKYFNETIGAVTDWSPLYMGKDLAMELVALSEALPDDDGWVKKFFVGGKEDLSGFSEQVASFGNFMVAYATNVHDITTDGTEEALTMATNVMSFFKDYQTQIEASALLTTLGTNFNNLGSDFKNYYNDVKSSKVKIEDVDNSIASMGKLVDVMTKMTEINSDSTSAFTTSLGALAELSVDEFVNAFDGAETDVSTAIANLITTANNALKDNEINFETTGGEAAISYSNGLLSKELDIKTAGENIVSTVIGVLSDSTTDFSDLGEGLANAFANGMVSQDAKTALESAGYNIVMTVISEMNYYCGNTQEGDAWTLGWNFGIGFYNGIVGTYDDVAQAAWQLGRRAVNNLQSSINSKSPSKETAKLGEYAGQGFVIGMINWIQKAGEAGYELGQASLDNLKATIQNMPSILANDINLNPTIRPIVDLTSAQQSANSLNTMFNRSVDLTAAAASMTNSAFETARIRTAFNADAEGINEPNNGNARQIIQYNTFEITSNDPEAVANAVSRTLQKQVERKESTWAQSSGTGYPRVRSRS